MRTINPSAKKHPSTADVDHATRYSRRFVNQSERIRGCARRSADPVKAASGPVNPIRKLVETIRRPVKTIREQVTAIREALLAIRRVVVVKPRLTVSSSHHLGGSADSTYSGSSSDRG